MSDLALLRLAGKAPCSSYMHAKDEDGEGGGLKHRAASCYGSMSEFSCQGTGMVDGSAYNWGEWEIWSIVTVKWDYPWMSDRRNKDAN